MLHNFYIITPNVKKHLKKLDAGHNIDRILQQIFFQVIVKQLLSFILRAISAL